MSVSDGTKQVGSYALRWVEQVAVTTGIAFLGALAAEGGQFSKAGIAAAVAAGGRALYGFFVKPIGDSEQPNAAK